ncbi:hypothetical protein O6H91_23G030800 [Diphasiastrum complanatum]|uniref:Uncharacterized protein n=2 Tax=Diphasiastrum complanatum TaxID=34168 RepID=A0ACC2A9B6_DIPCM|nr:hypothetical protein O6H91_23G030800 [Diphasiastrum complanatum]KAJ7514155.1 hypothetical protein O6H91_23G030800 [Diphasiastrum complanatum]
MDLEIAHFNLLNENAATTATEFTSPVKEEYKRKLAENLLHEVQSPKSPKILAFNRRPTSPLTGEIEQSLHEYAALNDINSSPSYRHISSTPERILDAPDLKDDYYLNLIDWSCQNILAVALGTNLYLWNAETGMTSRLMSTDDEDNYITSVAWARNGKDIAVGLKNAEVQLWDSDKKFQVRKMTGHSARVGSLAWNGQILTTGGRDSRIINHDVRAGDDRTSHLIGHRQEVCGLKWSPSGHHLASGGNDNLLHIWDGAAVSASLYSSTSRMQYLHRWNDHQAAVKALAWCPFKANLLASGGGTADCCIKFWNAQTGACVSSVDTHSQVCALQWSIHQKEILSSHGYSQNQLCVWKYPSMTKIAELKGHAARVLHLALSPDGTTVVSAAADETLRFWKIFCPPSYKKTSTKGDESGGFAHINIR